jgi:hypothetical protein
MWKFFPVIVALWCGACANEMTNPRRIVAQGKPIYGQYKNDRKSDYGTNL